MARNSPKDWSAAKRREYQNDWDSFFKAIAPHSPLLKKLIEARFNFQSGLGDLRAYPTDLESRRVAEALHMNEAFKGLRADGIFEASTGLPILGFEYQSTHNVGMPVRVFMYQEAFDEKNAGVLDHLGMRFVIIYSGKDMPKKARMSEHLKVMTKEVSYLFIDLDQIDAKELEVDGIHSKILRLVRPDATDFAMFRETAEEISLLSDATERHRLMSALVVASMNKEGFGLRMLEIEMDEEIRKNLIGMIPIMDEKRLVDEKRRGMRLAAELSSAPEWVYEKITSTFDLGELEALYEGVTEAAKTRDWDAFAAEFQTVGFKI
ncbi:hypothetical protein [Rhizobium ruizarguesonis]|uniref:hypothetical protein n=1 Tax=Rhizobium ruizarguesonis TaxID=2081791 RepID=UPI00102F8C66|nr:hypothetical protein [Rhizobium ruizarguesonis]TBE02301.1 hypothetical protein ELH10_15510 [Rhizobium ruizarguesonis]TBF14677.1 hypothetical protein ELG95_14655 [Rhizobium ruizarguesonis]